MSTTAKYLVRLSSRARLFLWFSALASLSAPISQLIPPGQWPTLQWLLELAAHWQWLYLFLGLASLAVALLAKRSVWLAVPAAALVLSFSVKSTALPAGSEPSDADSVLTVASANLNFASTDFNALSAWLSADDAPEVLFLQEFTAQAQQALATPALLARYPYRVEAPQADQFGLAVLSRFPLTDMQRVEPQALRDTLRLRADMSWQGRQVPLSALHPMPPLDAGYAEARDRALREEAAYLTQKDELALMAGDFNTTPWARGLRAIDGQLRRANSLAPTWPNALGGLSLLPLDHVLAGPGWRVLDSAVGPNLGSDHRPVVVRLVMHQGGE